MDSFSIVGRNSGSRERRLGTKCNLAVWGLLSWVALMGLPVAKGVDVYWRSDWTDLYWDSSQGCSDMGTPASPWWYNGWEPNNARGRPDCYGNHIVHFNNNNQVSMTLNTSWYSVNQILFEDSTGARTMDGGNGINLYNAGAKIENNVSAAQTFNVPIALQTASQLNPVNGDLTFNATIWNNGNWLDVWGDNSKTLTLGGVLDQGGGVAVKQSSLVILTNDNTFTGAIWVEKGRVQLGGHTNAMGAGGLVNVGTNATLDLNYGAETLRPSTLNLFGTGTNAAAGALRKTSTARTVWPGDIALGADSRIVVTGGGLDTRGAVAAGAYTLYVTNTIDVYMTAGAMTGSKTAGDGALHKSGSAVFTLRPDPSLDGGITLNQGTIRIATGTMGGGGAFSMADGTTIQSDGADGRTLSKPMTINGQITLGAASSYNGALSLTNAVSLGGGLRTIRCDNTNTVSGEISNGGLIKDGVGMLILSGLNNYDSVAIVSNGVLRIAHQWGLGWINGDTEVRSGAALELIGGISPSGDESLTLDGAGQSNGGALRNISGNNTFAGPITLSSAVRINSDSGTLQLGADADISGAGLGLTVGGAGTVDIWGDLPTGAATLTKDGPGTLTLNNMSATRTWSGATAISEGLLQLTAPNGLSDNSAVTVSSGATLDLAAGSDTVGSIAGDGSITMGNSTLTAGGDNSSTAFGGVMSGAGGVLVKQGTGTLTLTGANTHGGNTTVSAGTLIQNGTNANSAVTVNSGAFLYGSGQVAALTLAGEASAGSASNTVGNLVAAAVNLQNNGRLQVDLSAMTGTAGTDWDLVDATGDIAVNAADGSDFVVALKGNPTFDSSVGYTNTIISSASNSGFATNKFTIDTDEFTPALDGGTFIVNESEGNLRIVFAPYVETVQAVWDGGGADSLWDTVMNWMGDEVPPASSNILFYTGIASGANIYLNGDRTVAGLTFNDNADSAVTISSNTLTINGQGIAMAAGADGAHVIASDVSLGSDQSWTNDSTAALKVSGVISGTHSLTKQGSGVLELLSANVYEGATLVQAGTLRLGGEVGIVTVSNSSFEVPPQTASPFYTTVAPVGYGWTFSSAWAGIARNSSPWYTPAAPDGIQGAFFKRACNISQVVTSSAPGQYAITFSSVSRGGGLGPNQMKLQVDGSEILAWAPPSSVAWSSYTGTVYLANAGAHTITILGTNNVADRTSCIDNVLISFLRLVNGLPTNTPVSIAGGAVLDLNGVVQTVASLADYGGSGGVVNNNATAASVTLTLSALSGTTTFSGVIADGVSSVGLMKLGESTQIFTGTSTNTGATTVGGGVLIQNGTNASSAVTVNGGAFLYGVGRVGNLTITGQVSAGRASNTAGKLTAGAVNLQNNGILQVDISSMTGTAGADWDLLDAGGAVAINAVDGSDFVIALKGSPVFDATVGYTNTLVVASGSISGFASNKFSISTADFASSLDGGQFTMIEESGSLKLVFSPPPPAQAIWDGEGVNSLWDTPENWIGNVTPAASSNAAFYASLASGTNINLNGDRTVAGLTFNDDADTALNIRSNTLTINEQGIVVDSGAGAAHTIGANVVLGATQAWRNASAQSLTVSAPISGAGGLRKQGAGPVRLMKPGAYTGGLWVDEGTLYCHTNGYGPNVVNIGTNAQLELFNSGAAYSGVGPVSILVYGTNTMNRGAVRLANNNAARWYGNVSLFTNAMFRVDGVTVYMNGGSFDLNGHTLYLNSENSFAMETATVIADAYKTDGDGAIYKTGAGYLQIYGYSTLVGSIHIVQGSLGHYDSAALPVGGVLILEDGVIYRARGSGAALNCDKAVQINGNIQLGGSNPGVTVLNGPVDLHGGFRTITAAKDVTIKNSITNGGLGKAGTAWMWFLGTNTYEGGAIVSAGILYSGTCGLPGWITNNSILSIWQVEPGTLAGPLSGSGAVWKEAAGEAVFSGSNNYSGITSIKGGVLTLTHPSALGLTSSGTVVTNGCSLKMGGGMVTLPEPLTLRGDGYGNIGALVNAFGNNLFSGPIALTAHTRIGSQADMLTLTNTITGYGFNLESCGNGTVRIESSLSWLSTGAVSKIDAGILILSGTSTNSGGTTITAGTLIQNGTNIVAPVTVSAGGTLMGAGQAAAVTASGTVWPGASATDIGCLHAASLTMNNGSAFRFKLGDCTDATDRDFILNDGAASIAATVKVYPDSSAASNWDSNQSYSWILIQGGVSSLDNLALDLTYWALPRGGGTFSLALDGSNLVLNYTPGTGPDIMVLGTNGASIFRGDATPSEADGTDYGALHVDLGGSLTRTFTVTNQGDEALTLAAVAMGGAHAADFTVTEQPAASVAISSTTTFQVRFDPSAVGPRSATLYITNNVTDMSPYTLALQGVGDWPGIQMPTSIVQSCMLGLAVPTSSFAVTNVGYGTLSYAVTTNATWLTVSPVTGLLSRLAGQQHTVSYQVSGMAAGSYTGLITVTDAAASNSPRTAAVVLTLTSPPEPNSASVVGDGNELTRLTWNPNSTYTNLMIVHRAGAPLTAPTPGQAYGVGDACGGGEVLWTGASGFANYEHVVAPGQTHYYMFYTVVSSYYSAGLPRQVALDAYDAVVTEPFAYTNGVSLAGLNSAGNWADAWSVANGAWSITNLSASPGFPNMPWYPSNRANRVRVSAPDEGTESSAVRHFAPVSGGSLYVSALMTYQYKGVQKWAGIELVNNADSKAFVGKPWNASLESRFGLEAESSQTLSADYELVPNAGTGGDTGNVYLVIMKYNFSTRELSALAYYRTNQVPANEPSWAVSRTLSEGYLTTANGVRLKAGSSGGCGTVGDVQFDEIRVATSWEGVCNPPRKVIYDWFPSASGRLYLQGGGYGWGANTWQCDNDDNHIYDSGSFGANQWSCPTPQGHKIKLVATVNGSGHYASRAFETNFTSGKVYFSWMQNFDHAGGANSAYAGLYLMSNNQEKAFIGKVPGAAVMGLRWMGGTPDTNSAHEVSNGTGHDYLFVGCYDFDTRRLSANVYATNECVAEEPNGYWDVTTTLEEGHIDRITGIRLKGGVDSDNDNMIGNVYFDEVRVGTNWYEVTRREGEAQADAMIQGPIPRLLYVGTNYVAANNPQGSLTDITITDGQLYNTAEPLDFAVLWENVYGIWVTNANGALNISSRNGPVSPNWDPIRKAGSVSTEIGYDAFFTNFVGANGANTVTTYVHSAFNITNAVVNDTFYLSVTAENLNDDGGSFNAPNGADAVPYRRALSVNTTLQFYVQDDDDARPLMGDELLAIYRGNVRIGTNALATNLIANWNFNASNTVLSRGVGSMTYTCDAIAWYNGTTLNRVGSDVLGEAFGLYGNTINYKHFQFEISMGGHRDLVVSYALKGTESAATNQQWSWSCDGSNFTHHTTIPKEITTQTAWSVQTIDFSNVPRLNGATSVFIRCTLMGAATSGHNIFDNVQLNARKLVYELSDAELVGISEATPLRFVFAAYDEYSGLARGTTDADTNTSISIENVTDRNVTDFRAAYSSSTTTGLDATNAWQFTSMSSATLDNLLAAVSNEVWIYLRDADFDRVGDQIERAFMVGWLKVTDNDPFPPETGTLQPGNLLRNPGFEESINDALTPKYWETIGTSFDGESPFLHGGKWGSASRRDWPTDWGNQLGALCGTWAGAGDSGGFWQEATNNCGAGAVFEASAMIYNNATDTGHGLKIEFYDGTRVNQLAAYTNQFADPGATWTLASMTATSPANTAWIRWVIYAEGLGGSGAYSIDQTCLRVVTNAAMDIVHRGRSFYTSGSGTNALFVATDGDLAATASTDLFKFVFAAWDSNSVQRSAASEWMNYDLGGLGEFQNLYNTYRADLSSADTTGSSATSVFSHVYFTATYLSAPGAETGQIHQLLTAGEFPVSVSGPDADADRPGDEAWMVNRQFGRMQVVDDDTNGPRSWLIYAGSNYVAGQTYTNTIYDDALTDGLDIVYQTFDPSGVFLTNQVADATNADSSAGGNVNLNWDLVNPAGEDLLTDVLVSPENIHSLSGNGSLYATTTLFDVQIPFAARTVGVWRIQTSSQDADNDRGVYGDTVDGLAHQVSFDRAFQLNDWLQFNVIDDDSNYPTFYATNLLINPSFEINDIFYTTNPVHTRSNWVSSTGRVLWQGGGAPGGGAHCLRIYTEAETYETIWRPIPATEGKWYTFSIMSMRNQEAPCSWLCTYLKLECYDSTNLYYGNQLLTNQVDLSAIVTTSWRRLTHSIYTPPGTKSVRACFGYSVDYPTHLEGPEGYYIYWDDAFVGESVDLCDVRIGTSSVPTSVDGMYIRGTETFTNTIFYLSDESLYRVASTNPLHIRLGVLDADNRGRSGLLRGTTDPAAEMNLSIEGLCTNNVANFCPNKSSPFEETKTVLSSNVWEFDSFSVDQINALLSLGSVKIVATVRDADADRPADQLALSNQQFGVLSFADDDTTAPVISSLDVSGSSLYKSGTLLFYDFGSETLTTNPTFALERLDPAPIWFHDWAPDILTGVAGNPGRAAQASAGWMHWGGGVSYFMGRFAMDAGFSLNLTNVSFDYHTPIVDLWSFRVGLAFLVDTNPPVRLATNDLWATMNKPLDSAPFTGNSTWRLAGIADAAAEWPWTIDNVRFQGTVGPIKGLGYIGDGDLAEGTCVITGLVRDVGNGLLSISEPLGPRVNIFFPDGSQLFTNQAFTTGPTVNGQGQTAMPLAVALPAVNRAAIALGSYTGSVSVTDNDWDRPGDEQSTNVPLSFTVFDDDLSEPRYGTAFQFLTNLSGSAHLFGAMAPFVGDDFPQGAGSQSNRVWYVTDKHMVHAATTNVELHFNLYDLSGCALSSETGGSNMTVSVENYVTDNYANYNAGRSSLDNANNLFATSVWAFASFSDVQIAALMETTSRVSISVTDRDTDRPDDSLGRTDWQLGYIAWRDNDPTAPALQTLRNTNASLLVWLGGTSLQTAASSLWIPPTPQTNIVSSNQIFQITDGQLAGVSETNLLQFRFHTYDLGRDNILGLQRGTTFTANVNGHTLTNTHMSVGATITNNTANFRGSVDWSSPYEHTKDALLSPTSTWVYTSFTYDQVGELLSVLPVQSNQITLAVYDADNDRNLDQASAVLEAGWLAVSDDDASAPVVGSCGGTRLKNSSFELMGGTAYKAYGWDYGFPDESGNWWGTATRENWRARSGAYEMSLNAWSPGTNAGIWQQAANTSPDGTLWNGSAWFWSDNGVGGGPGLYVFTAVVCEVKIEFFDAGFTMIDSAAQSFTPPGEVWTQVSLSKTSPVGTAWARLVVAASGMGSAGTAQGGGLQIDDVMFGPTPPLAVKVGEVYIEASDASTNAVFTIFDSQLGTNSLSLLFGGYDPDSGLARGASSATTQMNVTVEGFAANNVANYSAADSTADSTSDGAASVWKWTLSGAEINDLIAAGPMRILATLYDADNDRAGDYLVATNKQYGYLRIIDDDTNAPAASELHIKNGQQMTDSDIRFGLWNINMVLADESEVALSTEGEYFAANYSLINAVGAMVHTAVGWTYTDRVGASNIWTVGRAAPGVGYADVTTGLYSFVWSATDKDSDRASDRLQTLNSTNILYSTNTFLVVDDDVVEPTTPSNIVMTPYGWTNVNHFVLAFDPSLDASGISEYRVSTNTAEPSLTIDGEPLAATYVTNYLPTLISNASFEVGSDELSIPADPDSVNNWRSFVSDGGYLNFADEAGGQEGTLATRHIIAAGTRADGSPRYTLCSQDIYLNNSNRLRPFISFSGWFKGDLSRVGVGNNYAAGFLKAEGFNAISVRTWIVENEWDDDHNGSPLVGVNAAVWTQALMTVTNATADTEFIRLSCGISGHNSQMPSTGYWDHLSVTVSVQSIGGVIYTNAPNGITTNWFFAVDDDDDRLSDRLKSPNTNFVIMYDGVAPTQIMNVVVAPGSFDDTSEIDLTWSRPNNGGGVGADPLSPWRSYKIYYTDDNTAPTTNSPHFTFEDNPALSNRLTEAITLSNFVFGIDYNVAIAGVDAAGNEGPMSDPHNVLLSGFFVTQGVAVATTDLGRAEIAWTAAEGREYDLIYTDASDFSAALSNRWQLAGRGVTCMLCDTGDVDAGRSPPRMLGNNMRFYRAAQKDRWMTNQWRRVASEGIYALKAIHLKPGFNWVSFPGVPDTCTAFRVFGHNLPSGESELLSTRVSWHKRGSIATATQTIWLSSSPLQWQSGDENADDMLVPLNEGVVIEIPEDATAQTSLFIGRIPTNTQEQLIKGGTMASPAYNLVSFGLPRNVHPSQMNLLESGFKGGLRPSHSDKLLKYDRANQQVSGAGIWYKTSDMTWREASGVNGAIVGYNCFTPDDGIVIAATHTNDWVWTNKLIYTLPTRFMSP